MVIHGRRWRWVAVTGFPGSGIVAFVTVEMAGVQVIGNAHNPRRGIILDRRKIIRSKDFGHVALPPERRKVASTL